MEITDIYKTVTINISSLVENLTIDANGIISGNLKENIESEFMELHKLVNNL